MSSAASTPGGAPKSMSSRLLTMKFMQRAAAFPTAPSPSTPDEPSPKRRKKESDSPSWPSFNVNALADQRAVQAAVAGEEAKRQAALEKAATEAGDTRWVLSFEDQNAASASPKLGLRVVQTGYAHLDTPNFTTTEDGMEEAMEEEKPVMSGRRSFGKFNKILEKKQSCEDGEDESNTSSEEDNGEESEEEPDNDPTIELIRTARYEVAERARAERKAKKRTEKAESEKLAKKRKKNEVKLNDPDLIVTSGRISGIGGAFTGSCYTCGGPHIQKFCPQNQNNKRGYRGGDDGPPRKTIKTR